ncbi:MAG: PEP-CTERM system histidine kinase PrsK [Desulfomicrobium sp.]|nr:PEP-CTERM system histidine kinase PrsK [Pseudomonadota bacterium]MBV1711364.1 PEP-CTERM system histidine kinase PrsK [Desulfomicrobium sp.]MBU4570766.1 PEP-CTERM system histidine kinase PrsK [Pseudomonadota bacterium]MBU4595255.1 PEP-CTERM system histidine kinase PrsK [Pseudomonadota bacterium]MBV1720688.1 PEP-CTERM system histidine kinase PrsK [Desulfomicrobium sp.]
MTPPFVSLLTTLCAITLALGFTVRMLLGVMRANRSRASGALALALLLTAGLEALDLLTLLYPGTWQTWRMAGLLVEGALGPAWIWFTALFARNYEEGRLPRTQRTLIILSCLMLPWAGYLATQGAYFAPDFATEGLLFLLPGSFYFYIGFAVCCVVALLNIEATLAAAVHHRRWKIKFILLGAVSILAALILYYSQSLLHRSIDMSLAGLRSLALLVGAGMMWFSDLRRGSEVRISFSKRMAFKSVVLVAAGLYLVGLGLLGEGARLFGDDLGRAVLLVASFLAGLGLLVAFLSDTVRRKIRLFLQLNFYGEKYDYRIQWVQFTQHLASARTQSELQQAALSACCETFGIVGAGLFLFDHGRKLYLPVSLVETDPHEGGFAEGSGLVTAFESRRTVLRAADVDDPSPWLERAGFAIPIFREGVLDGFVLLGPPINPREEYDEEDFELMDTMARHISSALLNMRLLDQLARSREMEIMGKVSAFVLHDLKNHVYTLSLMVDNARKHIGNPEFQKDLVDSLGSTVAKMNILISQLKGLPDRQTLKRESVDLLSLAREATRSLPQDRVDFQGTDVRVMVDSAEMGKVILNLCLNALEASTAGQSISVTVGEDPEPFVMVTDHGVGIAAEFMAGGLFEPFKSTKAKGMGIGLYQCKQIVEAHGGRIEVRSALSEGAEFIVCIGGRQDL